MGHFVSGCACPGTDEVCFSGRSRFSPHTSPQRPGAHHRIKSVPKGCAACIGKCRSKGLGAFPQQAMFLYRRKHCLQLIVWRGKAYMVLAVESNNDNVNSTLVINFANIYRIERLIVDLLKCSSGSFTGSHRKQRR